MVLPFKVRMALPADGADDKSAAAVTEQTKFGDSLADYAGPYYE
jgi:hypothetical protein